MLDRILKQGKFQFSIFTDVERTEENRVGETYDITRRGEDEISTRKNYLENIKERNNFGFRCEQQDDNKTNTEYKVGEIVVNSYGPGKVRVKDS